MIRTLVYLGIILLGMVLAPMLAQNKGYVLITLGDYQIEMSAIALFVVAIIFYSLLQATEWLLVTIINTLMNSKKLPKAFFKKQAKANIQKAMQALVVNNHQQASLHFAKGAKDSKAPSHFYLMAAKSAISADQLTKASQYLDLAKANEDNLDACRLVEVELATAKQDYEAAKALLNEIGINKSTPDNLIRLANDIAKQSNDQSLISELLPHLKRKKQIDSNEFYDLHLSTTLASISDKQPKDLAGLKQLFSPLSRKDRLAAETQAQYHQQWQAFAKEDALSSLLKLIKKSPQQPLLQCLANNWQWQDSEQIEATFTKLTSSTEVLECQLQLLNKSRLYKQAKQVAQALCQQQPTPNHYQQLAQIQLQLGEQQGAISSFQLALK